MNSTLRSFLRLVSVTLALAALTSAEVNNVKKNIDNVPAEGIGRKLDTSFFSPTLSPTASPSEEPTKSETASPTFNPTGVPSEEPTATPTGTPTFEPTGLPSSSPSRITSSPTAPFTTLTPTMAPTLCAESYLTSEKLNIGLVIDLSYSTYQKEFSSLNKIGDFNEDGKPNTILDAQIIAIQDLLGSIAESDSLNNDNCEIGLISFDTDAEFHRVWNPTNDAGDDYNDELMDYIKKKLRTPTNVEDIKATGRGYTNFDAALDVAVEYFANTATKDRNNLLVFLSDGEPNVRGDGDDEGWCSEDVHFWNYKKMDFDTGAFKCSAMPSGPDCPAVANWTVLEDQGFEDCLAVAPGERHEFCRDDQTGVERCAETQPYQDCVRGPNHCKNHPAVTNYTSEINALIDLNVERLAIGVGDESNVEEGSALWMIDNNPNKELHDVLPTQALTLEELSSALSNLCILNTDPPTGSPSVSPTDIPTSVPTPAPTSQPTSSPTTTPTSDPTATPTPEPTSTPTSEPTGTPTSSPTPGPTGQPTSEPTNNPTSSPTPLPTGQPTGTPTGSPSEPPTGSFFPSSVPTSPPTESSSPTTSPTGTPTSSPTSAPTGQPTEEPTSTPTHSPTESPTSTPTNSPTESPTGSPTSTPTDSPTQEPTGTPTGSPTDSPTSSPTQEPTGTPTGSPTAPPTNSFSPTYVLPDCYDGPKMVVKDSSDYDMCEYNPGMVTLDSIDMMTVNLIIENVWGEDPPAIMKIFVHDNGIDAVLPQNDGDGFQCIDNEGMDIDLTEGETSIAAQCYPDSDGEGASWYAVIDVVITDPDICDTNEVADPCGSPDPILQSCSWRIVVPCSDDLLCTEDPTVSPTEIPTSTPTNSPTGSPTGSPTSTPTESPTGSPTSNPTSTPTESPTGSPTSTPTSTPTESPTGSPTGSPTSTPTESPTGSPTALPTASPTKSPTGTPTGAPTTAPFDTFGDDDDDTDDNYFCPEDITVLKHEGVTTYPDGALTIISQDTTSVTVRLTQTLTDSNSTIDNIFYQYKPNHFDSTCLEEDDVEGGEFVEVTIECTVNTEIAMFEFWVVDDISKDVLSEGDDAVIPKCCHPDGVPPETPTTKYLIEVKCTTECPEVVQ